MSASSRYCCQVDVKCRAADPVLAADIGRLRRFGFEYANFTLSAFLITLFRQTRNPAPYIRV